MAERSAVPLELGTEKIGKLLKQYALPAIIAQTASSSDKVSVHLPFPVLP